ncbi:hypothetical protein FSP39_009413 [Pinctada imbricata]|uniref:Glutamate receptor 1 n=1 Tax=Pinctada imbricata TaxID=66713 RepID=A0AA89C306_PINIB|nr:hypothetical protein FSP39_009413 [Pinctada imbricata]
MVFLSAGLFEPENVGAKITFRWTIQKLNLQGDNDIVIVSNPIDIAKDDSFQVSKRVCSDIEAGGKAVFGPTSRTSVAHVQSICNFLAIPHIKFHWDPYDINIGTRDPGKTHMSINVYPHYIKISEAYRDLINHWGWTTFTVIYEDNDGLIRLQEVLKTSKKENMKVTVRKLDRNPDNFIKMFKDIKLKNENRFIIDCHVSKVGTVLHKASQVNVISEYFHYLFTTLDLAMVDLENFKHNGANITALRIVNPENPIVSAVTGEWKYEMFRSSRNNQVSPLSANQKQVSTENAMMYDAVMVFDQALERLLKAHNMDFDKKLSCNGTETWSEGSSLLNYMKTMDFEGMTGRVHFGEFGLRNEFSLDIIDMTVNGLEKSGVWYSTQPEGKRINITKSQVERKGDNLSKIKGKRLKVITKTDAPYVFDDKETYPDGRIRYTGFAFNIFDLIAKRLNFSYDVVGSTTSYGNCNDQGVCDGMMDYLYNKSVDVAVAGMTITYEREKFVDFTKPFLNLGITILYRKPKPEPPALFSFLNPLHLDVWIYMIAGILCVSFMLFVIARFTPYEWCNPHPCDPNTDVVENQFSILNSLWFTVGALMQQGCEIAPRAVSTRMVAVVWWFFTLIMISSYTANLAAFLTVTRMVSPIESAEDLAKQTKIKYGTLENGSTQKFFEQSQFPTFQKMYSFMKDQKLFVRSAQEGYNKVLNEEYAYFAESPSIEYQIQRKCDLMQIGNWLNSIGYGIAFPRNSPWRDQISNEILRLQEAQEIQRLFNLWWKELDGGGKCTEETKKISAALTIDNVGGVFVLLVGGCLAGLLVALFEFVWKARKNAREDKQTLCSEMGEELRFAVRCAGPSTKPVKRKPDYEVTDNGVNVPLQGNKYGNNFGGREMYA